MKIYTNEGNPLGLKLLMLVKCAGREATLHKITLNDAIGKNFLVLPVLELDDGTNLFSTVAAAKYLFPNEGLLRDEWLEWSITLLAPALAHHMATSHRADSNALPVLNALVKKLDDRLQTSAYLTGNARTAADISVWSLLTPDGTLKGAQSIQNLLVWYHKLSAMPEAQAVLSVQTPRNLTFGALQNSNCYGGLCHIPLITPSSPAKLLAETGTNIVDTISDEEIFMARSSFIHVPVLRRKEPRTVLPKANERNILITSALPYVNNVPHLGNIIGCVLSADIFARYCRSVGYNTLLICGTDEYGTATENKALAENLTPQEICDKYFEIHNSIYRWFGIGFDYFGRTTAPEQTEIVQDAFKNVYEAGYIIIESVEQLLCQKCNRFLADRFVEGTCPYPGCDYEDARGDQCDKCGKLVNATELIRPRCKVCNTAPVVRLSDQMFLDLPKIEPKLREWVDTAENGWTNNARVITRAWLREGLKPRCITRDLKWGIPVPHPGFENKVFYVWFDAPFGYVSMTKHYTKDYRKWWQPDNDVNVELFQFMAKDNVPFHSVMWPSALLAMDRGYTLASHIMATEYLNYEDGKFSKSRGIGVFGNDAQETGIPADVWRFYLASSRPEGQDSTFSWNDLAARNNSELLNNLGNFVNRALVFCEKNFNGIVPAMNLIDDDVILLALINRELRGYFNALEKARLRDGIRHLLSISRHGNGFMQAQQPWVLFKGTQEQKERAGTVIGVCINIACWLANLILPYMPTTARTMFDQLNANKTQFNVEKPFTTILLPTGHKIGTPAPLFLKLDQAVIDNLKKQFSGQQNDIENRSPNAQETMMPSGVSSSENDEISLQQLETAIQRQADKVRELKAKTKDKSVWQPEVNMLLNLKKQLTETKLANSVLSATGTGTDSTTNICRIKELENLIAKQGEKVRSLKASADAAEWKPEVEALIGLKNELSALTGSPGPTGHGKNKRKK